MFAIFNVKRTYFPEPFGAKCCFPMTKKVRNTTKYIRNAWSITEIDMHAIKSVVAYYYIHLHKCNWSLGSERAQNQGWRVEGPEQK